MAGNPTGDRRWEIGEQRRERFEELVQITTLNLDQICAQVGIVRGTYEKWRKRHPDFALRIDAARRDRIAERPEYDGTFVTFRKRYLGHDTPWFQQRIADILETAALGSITLILVPPLHGKTTELEDWCTYKLAVDPTFRIMVVSGRQRHAANILGRVRNRFEEDGPCRDMVHRFGPFAPFGKRSSSQPWAANHFNVYRKGNHDERDFSMAAVGITTQVQGTRTDLMILDDIQSLETINATDDMYDKLVQDFLSRPSVKGRTVIIGTRVGEWDVYRRLIDAGIPDHTVCFGAYETGGRRPPWPAPQTKTDIPPKRTRFLWPEQYSPAEYAKMRWNVGEKAWARNYMQHPESASDMTFSAEVTDRLYDDHRSVLADPPKDSRGLTKVVVAVDPSIGGRNFTLAAALLPQRIDVLACRADQGLVNNRQIVNLIGVYCDRYTTETSKVIEVVIEDKAFQKGLLADDALVECQRRYGFRIVGNTTGRDKIDPDIGIPGLPHSILRDEITVPWTDERSRAEMQVLLDDLHIWRPGRSGVQLRQDGTMTLWFAWTRWRVHRDTPLHPHADRQQFKVRPSPLRTFRHPKRVVA